MNPQEALARFLHGEIFDEPPDNSLDLDAIAPAMADRALAALAEAGYTIVRSDDLLDIARIAGADLSGIDHAGQLAYPPLIEYVAAEVRTLRESYDECLKETP